MTDKSSHSPAGCPFRTFDPESEIHAQSWVETYQEMRTECPRPWSEQHGGFWIATKYEDVVRIAQNSDIFTSGKKVDPETGQIDGGLSIPAHSYPALIPLETDRPEWEGYRQFLNRKFAPKVAEARRPLAEGIARTLIDNVIETGRFDIVEDFTNPLPALITLDLLGFDLENWREFGDAVHAWVYTPRGGEAMRAVMRRIDAIKQRIVEGVAERRENPRDDLLSYLSNGEIEGRPVESREAIQMALTIVFGGVDTTTALTSNVFHYLARYPEQRQRLIDDPGMIPTAREEFVRFFAPVHSNARQASEDATLDGWEFRKGDRILLAYASANRDEAVFEDAGRLKLDRFPNRHIGFGAGIHRCLGSFLARVMFESMLKEVLLRIPDYQVVEAQARSYPSIGKVNGWISIPVTFTPGPKLGGGYDFKIA